MDGLLAILLVLNFLLLWIFLELKSILRVFES